MIKVSFVVTVYNKAPFLPEVIEAIKSQTGDFEREYVFVNDGSTDNSWDVVKEQTQDLENLVLVDQENQGVAIATNNGIRAASGDYIKLVDADDILAPFCTEILLQTMNETECGFALGISGEYEDLDDLDFDNPDGARVVRFKDPLYKVIDDGYARVSHCLFERERFERAGLCDERVFSQDHSLFIRLSAQGELAQLYTDVCASPRDEPGRIMNNEAQVFHDATLALAYFVQDNPDMSSLHRRVAQKKIVSRAWKWARKKHGAMVWSYEYMLYVVARLGVKFSDQRLVDLCAVFRKNATIRRP